MRRTIHLSGRKELPGSCFDVEVREAGANALVCLTIVRDTNGRSPLDRFPKDAELRLRLSENNMIDVLRFGSVANPNGTAAVEPGRFTTPSCQLRVVDPHTPGKLLGSTRTRVYKPDGQTDGILHFVPYDTAPRLWELHFPEDNYPVLRVDKGVPNAAAWASSDPTFLACTLPAVVEMVMIRILDQDSAPEDGWMADWLAWSDTIQPGADSPPFRQPLERKSEWIAHLIDGFARRHDLAGLVRRELVKVG